MSAVKRFFRRWGFLIALAAALALLHQVALPFVLAVMLAYVLAPAVERLSRIRVGGRHVPRVAAVITLYAGLLGALAVFFAAFLPRLSGDFARIFREAPPFFAKVKTEYAPRASAWLERNFPSDTPTPEAGPREENKLQVTEVARGRWEISLEGLDVELDPIGQGRYTIGPRKDAPADGRFGEMLRNLARVLETETMNLLKLGQRFVVGVVKGVAGLVLILMVAGFLLVDKDRILGFLRALVPPARRAAWDELLGDVDRGLAGVVRGQLAICLVNGVLTYVGLAVLHVKYAILLGAVAGAMSFIPVFGSILSSIPIVSVALVAGQDGVDLGRGLATLGWIVGIHLLEANFLNPKIIGGAAKIHPVVVIFALLVGEELGGLPGALVAVPTASILQAVFLFLRRRSERVEAEVEAAGEAEARKG